MLDTIQRENVSFGLGRRGLFSNCRVFFFLAIGAFDVDAKAGHRSSKQRSRKGWVHRFDIAQIVEAKHHDRPCKNSQLWAAVAGASIGVAASGVRGANRQGQDGRDSLVRLTSAVDNLASRMDVLHADLRVRDQELFARISDLEQNVARLEGHANRT